MDEFRQSMYPEFNPEDVIESVVIEHPGATNDRSAARRIALQVLYEIDSAGHKLGDVMAQQLEYHELNPKATQYLHLLVSNAVRHRDDLDHAIQEHAPEWPLDQVALVDRNILRLTVTEFAIIGQVPVKVAIDEAVELAKLFGAESAPRFVNGVLGALADDVARLRKRFKPSADAR